MRVTKDSVEVATLAYDPEERRVESVVGGVMTRYVYDGDSIVKQVAGSTTTRHVHGPGVDEPLASENAAGQLTYEHADGLGSELRQTNSGGAVTSGRSYEPFGQLQSGGATSGFAFTGREWAPETGLYYYRARFYDSEVGRFVSEDPIGFEGGINAYAYVENNPAVWIDPSGLHRTWADWWWLFKDNEAGRAKLRCWKRQVTVNNRRYGGDTEGARSNAFKHCFWSCCIAKQVGACRAEQQTNAHEEWRGNPPRDKYMDLSNNRQGLSLANLFPNRNCERICLSARARYYGPEESKTPDRSSAP